MRADIDLNCAIDLAREYGATRLILFGSYLTNPESARDLDLAVEGIDGWKIFELAGRIERTLRVSLDLIPIDQDTPFTRHIRARGKVLYER